MAYSCKNVSDSATNIGRRQSNEPFVINFKSENDIKPKLECQVLLDKLDISGKKYSCSASQLQKNTKKFACGKSLIVKKGRVETNNKQTLKTSIKFKFPKVKIKNTKVSTGQSKNTGKRSKLTKNTPGGLGNVRNKVNGHRISERVRKSEEHDVKDECNDDDVAYDEFEHAISSSEDGDEDYEVSDEHVESDVSDDQKESIPSKDAARSTRNKRQVNDEDYVPYKYSYSKRVKKIKEKVKEPKEPKPKKPKVRKKDPMSGKGKYVCEFCPKVYKMKRKFLKHFIKDGTSCVNTCKYCGKGFHSKIIKKHVFYKHERTDMSVKGYTCDKCQLRFMLPHELSRHVAMSHSGQTFMCDTCGKDFNSPSAFSIHKQKHRDEGKGTNVCHVCNKSFSCRAYVKAHIQTVHNKELTAVCHLCGAVMNSKYSMSKHLRLMHTHKHVRNEKCTECSKVFKTRFQMFAHRRLAHYRDKKLACSQCPKKFFFQNELKDHMNIHLNLRPHKCPYCPYTAHTSKNLTGHKRYKHKHTRSSLVHVQNPTTTQTYSMELNSNKCTNMHTDSEICFETDMSNMDVDTVVTESLNSEHLALDLSTSLPHGSPGCEVVVPSMDINGETAQAIIVLQNQWI